MIDVDSDQPRMRQLKSRTRMPGGVPGVRYVLIKDDSKPGIVPCLDDGSWMDDLRQPQGEWESVMIEPWQELEVFADPLSAEVVAGLLRGADIPVAVVTEEPLPGLSRGTAVRVPSELVRRARWTLLQAEVTEAELTFLATGRLGDGPAEGATQ